MQLSPDAPRRLHRVSARIMEPAMTEPIVHAFTVDCPVEHAFSVWAEKTSLWWPPSHSVSGAPEAVVVEPREGGRIFERAPGGAGHDWGRLVVWEPPPRLAYSWPLGQDAEDATEVEVTFLVAAAGNATQVTIVHRGWERLGARGDELRERSVGGWAGLPAAYQAAI